MNTESHIRITEFLYTLKLVIEISRKLTEEDLKSLEKIVEVMQN